MNRKSVLKMRVFYLPATMTVAESPFSQFCLEKVSTSFSASSMKKDEMSLSSGSVYIPSQTHNFTINIKLIEGDQSISWTDEPSFGFPSADDKTPTSRTNHRSSRTRAERRIQP